MSLRLTALFAIAVATAAAASRNSCPDIPTPSISSPKIPADVCIPTGFSDIPFAYFDDDSWRSFVALVWPASPGKRGAPDSSKAVTGEGPRVFETYRSLWEVFHPDGSAPNPDFQAYESGTHNACQAKAAFGDLILSSSPPFSDIGQAGPGELAAPLVAQNGRYLHYLTMYNQTAFDYIVRNRLYLRSALPEVPSPRPLLPVVQFPEGSIAIKAAWVDLTGLPADLQKRYYRRMAVMQDPGSGQCARVSVGLAGMHIVRKTASRPQWIWSSFEQVDAVPPARMNAPGAFLLNDGKTDEVPSENPLSLVPLAREPAKPFNVVRSPAAPIHPKTAVMNLYYERLFKGTIWENYQLVVTQWPRLEGDQSVPVPATQNGDVSNTFPGTGATSAFANVTMETFDQSRPQLGCMSCHNQARMAGDFMWSVLDHAYPAKLAPAASAVRQPGH